MSKEMVFQNVGSQEGFTLENQDRKIKVTGRKDIQVYLEDLFVTEGQFVILTAPKAQHKVRYVQSCVHDEGIEVELGIEETGTRLFYKMCSKEECCHIFHDFYKNEFVPNMEEYKPVQFL